MSTVIHSWSHMGAVGAGPRFELEPGAYSVRATGGAVKVQRCVGRDPDGEEMTMVPAFAGSRRHVPVSQVVPGAERFEDFSTASAAIPAVFDISEPTVLRLFYTTNDGTQAELVKE
jgi:hypothetical protein